MSSDVLVLLAAYNGSEYLKEQLDSIYASKFAGEFSLVVGLDPSTDNTRDVLLTYSRPLQLIEHSSPSGSASQNFSRLMDYARVLGPEYCFFSDQDDVWFDDKMQVSLDKLKEMEERFGVDVPLLVFSDAEVVDHDLNLISPSFWQHEDLQVDIISSFKNLAVQNVGQGCTFVFNKALLNKVRCIPEGVRMHDHWLMLVASVFGRIDYMSRATLKYRQHHLNVVGARGMGLMMAIERAFYKKDSISKALSASQTQCAIFAKEYGADLEPSQFEFFESFSRLSSKKLFYRKIFCAKHKMRMASLYRTVGLYLFV
ncbi:glycosyltransferase [Pseudomonas putida]|uniref:glycosyltransferase n=1 Tax=Pseudomonas putida TaxID=303 RepID=UPI003CFFBB3C